MNRFKWLVAILLCYIFYSLVQAQPGALLTEINGNIIPFTSLKGKWVVLNYWASWCRPCLDEIEVLNEFYQTRQKDVVLFGINFDAIPIMEQQKLINMLGIKYRSLLENPGPALGLEGVRGVPATFIFNPGGTLNTTLYGAQTLKSLNDATQ